MVGEHKQRYQLNQRENEVLRAVGSYSPYMRLIGYWEITEVEPNVWELKGYEQDERVEPDYRFIVEDWADTWRVRGLVNFNRGSETIKKEKRKR